MASNVFYDLTETEAELLPVKSGQYIVCRDTSNVYFDCADDIRICFTKYFAFIETERKRRSILIPEEGKIYFVLDSGYAWVYYAGEWKKFGGSTVKVHPFTAIDASGWVADGSAFKYTLTNVANVKYFNEIIPSFDLSVQDIAEAAVITADTNDTDGTIVLHATNKPTDNLFVSFIIC